MEVQTHATDKNTDLSKIDLQSYGSNWVWRAIEALVTAKNFDPSATAIASRLNVSLEAAVNALEGLERLGVIVRTGKTYSKPNTLTVLDTTTHSKKDLLASHGHLAPQIIGMLNEESIFATRITLGSLKLVRKHADKLKAFLNSIDDDASQEENPDILAIEISIAQIGKNQGGLQ